MRIAHIHIVYTDIAPIYISLANVSDLYKYTTHTYITYIYIAYTYSSYVRSVHA